MLKQQQRQIDIEPRAFEPAPLSPWLAGEIDPPFLDEHDACAIVASIRKGGEATHGNLKRVLNALAKMGHRSGDVNGEGDGCGVLTDIPRRIWADALARDGKPAWLAEDRRFFLGHFMIPVNRKEQRLEIEKQISRILKTAGADVLISRLGRVESHALGRLAREQEPVFWQIAGIIEDGALDSVERSLFELILSIEQQTNVHVASLSSHNAVYKVRGSVETLYHYYPELRSPQFTSAITLGHTRYSTNTSTAFERVQPFNFLGHNGEINTIARFREQARMVGVKLVSNGSDSQDVDRTLGTLIHRDGFSLIEGLEILFPPILSEVAKLPTDLQAVYQRYREAYGPYTQGPAGLITRSGDTCAFSVDALGLRPLWFGETEKEYFFSSEKGVYILETLSNDPRPFSPGEKMAVEVTRSENVHVLTYDEIQQQILKGAKNRFGEVDFFGEGEGLVRIPEENPPVEAETDPKKVSRLMTAFGWGRGDQEWVQALANLGHDPIGSLGFDGPLAALSDQRKNIADYFKEAVAVVTNPAIDRQREKEHFSTQVVLGKRPGFHGAAPENRTSLALDTPILLESYVPQAEENSQSPSIASVLEYFGASSVCLNSTVTFAKESLPDALHRLAETAIAAAQKGARLILLDDHDAFKEDRGWIDPILAVAVVDRALRMTFSEPEDWETPQPLALNANGKVDLRQLFTARQTNLRREVGLVLRSGALRNLHDLVMVLGLGADAVVPYFMLSITDLKGSLTETKKQQQKLKIAEALRAGLEKVTSTMGIHELRGYGRIFSSIGLSTPLAAAVGTVNYCGSEIRGLTWDALEAEIESRKVIATGASRGRLAKVNHFYPKVWKAAGQVGLGEHPRDAFEMRAEATAKKTPVTLRHILDFKFPKGSPVDPALVDAGLTAHALPFVIASMSFGSQNEVAFRAYAEAAYRLNMISLNGEGGEILDMMGKYPHNRGQQIASGRFGVDINLINSSNLLEIKVGQGAKPGEGGHLPGRKVSEKVAAARHARQGVDLISPSNNHDIYSIEDLAQFIEELKTANPKARVAVKVPVVPGIGIIAVGIAKAGADIINLTGYDGGTGAARQHSLRYVGLPAEIGVVESHHALTHAGLRGRVELWCDGGIRTAADVVKMICLGANRVGFGTLAMVAIGCTICRACQTDTCHVGIATQIETTQQAEAHGLKHFTPQEFELATQRLVTLFGALGQEVKQLTARLGFESTQEMVGHVELLEQIFHHDQLDLSGMLDRVEIPDEKEKAGRLLQLSSGMQLSRHPLRRPRNHLTTVISNLVMETVSEGEDHISFEDDKVTPVDRALGTHLAGAMTRYYRKWMWPHGHGGTGGLPESWRVPAEVYNGVPSNPRHGMVRALGAYGDAGTYGAAGGWNGASGVNGYTPNKIFEANLRFYASSVPGNGLGAYTTAPMNILVEGGAQDGVGKGMHGGRLTVLKGVNHEGVRVDGSVGKGLGYGAIGGMIIIQGNADSRACIRLSGADVIIGGEIETPLDDSLGYIGARANVKGFLCEYMTTGRVLVLGDPGPWIGAGMTGGVLYLRLQPEKNFDIEAIQRRIARGADVQINPVDQEDEANLSHLLCEYAGELYRSHQVRSSERIQNHLNNWQNEFVKIEPANLQMDQTISTE